MTTKTKKRHEAIKDIIAKEQISDQQALLDRIKTKHNIEVSQGIISRDLYKLGIGKVVVEDKQVYSLPDQDATRTILRFAVLDIVHNETTIVIHTLGGCADFVGDYLDAQRKEDIIGTLSGENTIIVIPQSIKNISSTVKKLKQLLHIK